MRANTLVVESGAIPRDVVVSQGFWRSFSIEEAREALREGGYVI